MDTTTEFEISERVAESFAAKVRRPDKEDNIRIEALADAPQARGASRKSVHIRLGGKKAAPVAAPRQSDQFRDERAPKQHGKPHGDSGSKFGGEPDFKKKRHPDKLAYAGTPNARPACRMQNPAFGKKAKQKRRG